MKRVLGCQIGLVWVVIMWAACPASAQPKLQWTFDESASGSQDALDTGAAPAESGHFLGGATRTSNTPGGASIGAADLYGGVVGTDAFIKASDSSNLDGLSNLTTTTWINLQDTPEGNDRIVSLQAPGTPANADFNSNTIVEGQDYLTWQQNFGIDDGTAFPDQGDANGDGNVLADDLASWDNQYGGPPILHGAFAGFSLNLNPPNSGNGLSASEFRIAMFIGGLDINGDPAFDFGFSTADVGADDSWLFIASTFDGVTGALTYYSGTESGAVSQLGDSFILLPVEIETTGLNFYVGKTDGATAANTSLEGYVDDVRIYDSALTLTELEAVRMENLPTTLQGAAVPEPSALVFATLAAIAGTILRRRR